MQLRVGIIAVLGCAAMLVLVGLVQFKVNPMENSPVQDHIAVFDTLASFSRIRINCGSSTNFTDGGTLWLSDRGFTGGSTSSNSSISNLLMRSDRYFSTVSSPNGYKINVGAAGTYSVKLVFAEIYFKAAGQRKFKVQVEKTNITSYWIDLFSLAGYQKFWNKTVTVNTTDAYIDIKFFKSVNNPTLTAIEIYKPSTSTPAPTKAPTRAPTFSPATQLTPPPNPCPKITWQENFTSTSMQNFVVYNNAYGNSIDYSNGYLNLRMRGPAGTVIKSKNAYYGGYAEATMRLGGQGDCYSGVVHAFIFQSDPSNPYVDEIDNEILGLNTGEIETNWFHDKPVYVVNGKILTGIDMVSKDFKLGMYYDSQKIVWYINGVVKRIIKNPGFYKPQYIWGSIWYGGLDVPEWTGVADFNTNTNPCASNFVTKFKSVKYCALP